MFSELLAPYREPANGRSDGSISVEEVALDWLREGGKRLRPFVTLAACAVASHGAAILDCGDRTGEKIAQPIRRISLAIEALHKASLVHDDIEDGDEFRYGRLTLHRVHGVGQAINAGDYLIGLGYRLIAGEAGSLGAECTGDILSRLSHAHLELCRGQGAELAWQNRPQDAHRPADLLTVYALKTAPAFEVALYAGLRAAGIAVEAGTLRRFSTFVGEGFQIRNDLDDWNEDGRNKRKRGLDAHAGDPRFCELSLRKASTRGPLPSCSTTAIGSRRSRWWIACGIFMIGPARLRKPSSCWGSFVRGAVDAAGEFPSADLQELMRFLVRTILPDSTVAEPFTGTVPIFAAEMTPP